MVQRPDPSNTPPSSAAEPAPPGHYTSSILAWPAWLRALALVPALGLLWLAVCWALAEVAPL